ncbi:MAG: DUF4147 domain-containing protein [Rhizobiales bacterium]|nr:DUF4147 domain-containing protein [Hyphomicrobiales bacterium]
MKQQLIDLWQQAVQASLGENSVYSAIKAQNINDADMIIAVGKAAASMALGALKAIDKPNLETLIATKYGHGLAELDAFKNVTLLEAAHPIPDQNSLNAGAAILSKIKSLPKDSKLIFLVSGGASSLVEHLSDGLTLDDLQILNMNMMADGLPIGEMNKKRRKISKIKFGKLLSHFKGSKLDIFYISDVEGDALSTVGSGIGFYDADLYALSRPADTQPKVNAIMVAGNKVARQAVVVKAAQLALNVVCNEENLYDDIFSLAPKLCQTVLDGEKGLYIFGGEPTVNLPTNPGNGGRNQSLALAMAEHIFGRDDISIIVAGTDGTDGPTDAAGAIIDGNSFRDADAAKDALKRADAGTYLKSIDALYSCGPTGTNVMDVVIAIKR